MIALSIMAGAYVLCNECGNAIFAAECDNLMDTAEESLRLKCLHPGCGYVGSYDPSDLMNLTESRTIDYTSRLLLED